MKNFYKVIILLLCVTLIIPIFSNKITNAQVNLTDINYIVYDEYGNYLFESVDVVVGDMYIDKSFNKYEVYIVDELNNTAKARYVETLKKPFVTKKSLSTISNVETVKKIGLYMSHNDESYLIGDGTDSVYGAGGIHDIARKLYTEFQKEGITAYIDETLHIPHDSYAYTRSRVTATNLLKNDLNAIFDIHRDGASRSTYAKTTNGVEHSTIRIVVGQANANNEQNLQFALYLMSVSESICPWLFLDIFYARGHYNQDLFEKALLFEMGTYTIEKDLVLETVPYLADVINTTLFNTTVNENGDLTIGSQTLQTDEQTIDKALLVTSTTKASAFEMFLIAIATIGLVTGCAVFIFKYRKKNLQNIK